MMQAIKQIVKAPKNHEIRIKIPEHVRENDPVIGSEQGKTRPVLVISEDQINRILPVVNVLPITSRKTGRKIYPNEVLIPKRVPCLCYQIRTLDKKRFIAGLCGEVVAETGIVAAHYF